MHRPRCAHTRAYESTLTLTLRTCRTAGRVAFGADEEVGEQLQNEKPRKIPAMPVHDELKRFQARLEESEMRLRESEMSFKQSQTSLKDAKARELALEEQLAAVKGRLSQEKAKRAELEGLISSQQTEIAYMRELVSRSENRAPPRAPSALPAASLQKGRHNADQASP